MPFSDLYDLKYWYQNIFKDKYHEQTIHIQNQFYMDVSSWLLNARWYKIVQDGTRWYQTNTRTKKNKMNVMVLYYDQT